MVANVDFDTPKNSDTKFKGHAHVLLMAPGKLVETRYFGTSRCRSFTAASAVSVALTWTARLLGHGWNAPWIPVVVEYNNSSPTGPRAQHGASMVDFVLWSCQYIPHGEVELDADELTTNKLTLCAGFLHLTLQSIPSLGRRK